MSQFDHLYHKVLSDPQFRRELVAEPEQALRSVGIDPTPEVLASLKNIEAAVRSLETDLGGPEAQLELT
jgi:hypothetical protein